MEEKISSNTELSIERKTASEQKNPLSLNLI